MIEQNKKEFELCNIPLWWSKGYTGKRIKVAEIETSVDINATFLNGKVKAPLGISNHGHGGQVLDVMHQVAPDAELYALSFNGSYKGDTASGDLIEKTIPYVETEGIHIVGASLTGTNNKQLNERILQAQKKGAVFITSVGNDGSKGGGGFANSNVWISIGALHLNSSNGKYNRAWYSAIDSDLDFMGFSHLYVHSTDGARTFPQVGTSFSSPMICGMLALVQQFFLEKTGKTLNQKQVYQFMLDNIKDLGDIGFDELHGHGLFILPDPDEIDPYKYIEVEKMNNPNKIIIHHSATDGGTFESIKRYHVEVKGWKDIGYHYLITQDGVIHQGRTETTVGAHALGENDSSIGICLVGNFDNYKPTEGQMVSLAYIIKDIWERCGKLPSHGHNEFANKSCPGTQFPWKELSEMTKEHWAEKHFNSLNEKGIAIHEKRFDDKITRGEIFALLDRLTDRK